MLRILLEDYPERARAVLKGDEDRGDVIVEIIAEDARRSLDLNLSDWRANVPTIPMKSLRSRKFIDTSSPFEIFLTALQNCLDWIELEREEQAEAMQPQPVAMQPQSDQVPEADDRTDDQTDKDLPEAAE